GRLPKWLAVSALIAVTLFLLFVAFKVYQFQGIRRLARRSFRAIWDESMAGQSARRRLLCSRRLGREACLVRSLEERHRQEAYDGWLHGAVLRRHVPRESQRCVLPLDWRGLAMVRHDAGGRALL